MGLVGSSIAGGWGKGEGGLGDELSPTPWVCTKVPLAQHGVGCTEWATYSLECGLYWVWVLGLNDPPELCRHWCVG